MNKLLRLANSLKAIRSHSSYIQVTWPEPIQRVKPDKTNVYESLAYPDQLEHKKASFIKSFQNVLITLAYDELQDRQFKDSQQQLGQLMLDSLAAPVPLGRTSLNELLSVDKLDIGFSLDRSRLVVGRNVWTRKSDNSEEDEEIEDSNAGNEL